VCPHFFRRSADGWQMDVLAEVQNTREYAGGPFTWDDAQRHRLRGPVR
jgi:hypothetical protein